MSMDTPMVELMTALASYSVHRALLASRSTFFDGACRNSFQEAATGVIDLSEDDPEAVEYMVQYFYHLDYLRKTLSRRSSRRSSQRSSTHKSRLSMSRNAPKKLDLTLIEDPLMAMVNGANVSPPITPPLDLSDPAEERSLGMKRPDTPVADASDDDADDDICTTDDQAADVELAHLIAHAKVYAIAEKYGIVGLKRLAGDKFAQQLEAHISSPEFPEACQEAYESTIDSDRGLRDIVVQAFRTHPELSLRKDVELVVRDTPSLAFDLFRMASGLPITV